MARLRAPNARNLPKRSSPRYGPISITQQLDKADKNMTQDAAGRQAGKQAGRQVGRQAGKRAGRHASKRNENGGRQAEPKKPTKTKTRENTQTRHRRDNPKKDSPRSTRI